MMEILTSRSRTLDHWRCPRFRWHGSERGGTGYELVKQSIPLVTGGSVHAGLASLLRGEGTEDAVRLAISDYELRCSDRGFQLDDLESQSFVFAEQKALVEALVRVAALRAVSRLLEIYEVLEVERLDKRVLYEDEELRITWRSIPDALLRNRTDGQLYLLSWKTAGELPRESESRVDMQGVSEAWGIAARLAGYWDASRTPRNPEDPLAPPDWFYRGEFHLASCPPVIRGVQMAYLVKGQRRKASAAVSRSQGLTDEQLKAGGATYKQASPLIYGYQDKSFPPKLAWASEWRCTVPHPMRKSQWYPSGECPGDGRLHKRSDEWTSFPVWETLGVAEWLKMLDDGEVTPEAGDALGEAWTLPVPNYRTQEQLTGWLRQVRASEKRVAADLIFLREYEKAMDENPDDEELRETFQARLDASAFGPQHTDQCDRWFGRRCPMWDLCHGPEHIQRDPVGSGLYRIREHLVEPAEVEG